MKGYYINMNNFKALSLYDVLNRIYTDNTDKINVKVGYKMIQNKNELEHKTKSFVEMRENIIKKYAVDGVIEPTNEHYNDAINEISEIGNEECDINLKKIKLDDIGDVELTLADMDALSPMIDDDE